MKVSALFGLLTMAFLCLLTSMSFSQDVIVTTRNDSIKAKVMKVTVDKILYRFPGQSGLIKEIPKNQVKEIIYENGNTLTIIYNLYEVSPDLLAPDKHQAIKVDIGAPFFNHYTAGYEWRWKTGKNFELKAGVIWPGISHTLDPARGGLLKFGLKYIKCAECIYKGLKYKHPLKGTYLKPEIIISGYEVNKDSVKVMHLTYAASLSFGKQYIIGKAFVVDVYGSAGIGFQSIFYHKKEEFNTKDSDFTYSFSHLYFGNKLPIILSGGIMVGWNF